MFNDHVSEVLSNGDRCLNCGVFVYRGMFHSCMSPDTLQECGHPRRYMVGADGGPHDCLMCNFQAAEFEAQEATRILQAEVSQARKSALEEAANVCETHPGGNRETVARAIRALANEKGSDTSSGDPARQPTPAVADFASAALRRSG